MENITYNLVKIGMSENEARILESLFISGPSGASDIHSKSGVPRNKIYEILNRLAEKGIVEIQPGRPVLFRAPNPEQIVKSYVGNYRKAGEEILEYLRSIKENHEEDDEAAYAWVVKGKERSKRRLAELLYAAKTDIFMISGYPSEYVDHVVAPLKAAQGRGVNTRAVCMVRPMETLREDVGKNQNVEYRTVKDFSKLQGQMDKYDMKIISGFRDTSSGGGVAIIDEKMAFNIVDEGRIPSKVTGMLIKAPGAPRIQKGTIERILSLYTRRL